MLLQPVPELVRRCGTFRQSREDPVSQRLELGLADARLLVLALPPALRQEVGDSEGPGHFGPVHQVDTAAYGRNHAKLPLRDRLVDSSPGEPFYASPERQVDVHASKGAHVPGPANGVDGRGSALRQPLGREPPASSLGDGKDGRIRHPRTP